MRSKTLRALDLIVYINAQPWAFADSLDWTAEYSAEPIYGVDSMHPQEIPSGREHVVASLHYWRQHNTAGAEGAGIVPTGDALSRERYFYLQVIDRQTNTTYLEIPKAKLQSQGGSARAKGVVEGRLTITGMGWANEF